jgi:hypothetical protein
MSYNNNCVLNPEQETSSCDASAESASECEQSSAKNSCSSTSSGEEEEVRPSSSSNSGEEQQQQRRRSTLCASSSKTLLLLSSSSSQATLLQQKQQRHVQPPPPPLQQQTVRLRNPTSSTSRKQRPKSFTDASMTLLHQQKARNPSCFVGVSDTALNILSGGGGVSANVSGWSSSSGSASKVSSSVAGRRHAGRTKRSKPRLRSSTEDFPTTRNFVRSLSFAEEAQNNPTTFENFQGETPVKISTEEEILKVREEVGGVVKPQFQILGPVSTGGSGGGALLSEENNSSMNTDGLNGAEQDWDSYQVTNERPPGLAEALWGRVGAKVPSGRPLLRFLLRRNRPLPPGPALLPST